MASNITTFGLPPLPEYTLKPLPPLVSWLSDAQLSMAVLFFVYWGVSGVFHVIDTYDMFPQYRLHTPEELLKRNHASKLDVFKDVLLQQVVQTIFGLTMAALDPDPVYGKEEYDVAVWAQRIRIAQRALPGLFGLVGVNSAALGAKIAGPTSLLASALAGGQYPQLEQIVQLNGESVVAPAFASWELQLAHAVYYFIVPAIQFSLAFCILDTWQYFLHRAMHMNQWLYTTFHSRHHRLYVPYAYGALYNHPIEGFALDTLGSGIAYMAVGLTTRQCIFFFTFATWKTVDDHCGYAFPWDPMQHISGNNAAYHDIHHQSWGIKTNFSQPFFTFWDRALGTKWKGDVKLRYERARKAADEWWAQQRKKAELEASMGQAELQSHGSSVKVPTESNGTPVLEPPSATTTDSDDAREQLQALRRSPRKSAGNQSLKGLKDRVSGSLPNGVPRVESRR